MTTANCAQANGGNVTAFTGHDRSTGSRTRRRNDGVDARIARVTGAEAISSGAAIDTINRCCTMWTENNRSS